MEQQVIFSQIGIDQLTEILQKNVKEAVKQAFEHKHKNSTEYLTIYELMDYLPQKPAKSTIHGWCHKKTIPFVKRGKAVLFDRKEIDVWLQNRK
jgi:excisionase family DNA binding protein